VIRFALAVTLGLALFAVPGARADLAKWDQAKVTSIAGEIFESAEALRAALRREPNRVLGQGGRRAHWQLRDELQALVSGSRRLRDALAADAGMEETYPTFRRVLDTARRAKRHSRRMNAQKPVPEKIEAVADAIRRIRPFYEGDPPL
jgi:hypothetical protein